MQIEYIWLALFLAIDIFFIFLIWLAAPNAVPSFILITALFTGLFITIGLLVNHHQKKKLTQAFEAFLSDPNEMNTSAIMQKSPSYLHPSIQDLSLKLQAQKMQIDATQEDFSRYREFIESWTHEVKVPLSLITLVLANHQEEMSPHVYSRMEHVKTSISKEVDRVLYYARLQADHVDYVFNEILLDECVIEVLEDFQLTAQEQGTEIRLDLKTIKVLSDKKVLSFILSQLLSNALKYADPEDGLVEISLQEDKINQQIHLSIRNNGSGIPPENAAFIFDKGFTGNQPTRQSATGMGLYFVEKYAEALSITVELEPRIISEKGFGIRLTFPSTGSF